MITFELWHRVDTTSINTINNTIRSYFYENSAITDIVTLIEEYRNYVA